MEVFAIHEGCRFEGGRVTEIYSTEEKAIKFALMRVEHKKQEVLQIWEEDADDWDWNEVENHGEHIVKMWQNPVDQLIIYKYEVK